MLNIRRARHVTYLAHVEPPQTGRKRKLNSRKRWYHSVGRSWWTRGGGGWFRIKLFSWWVARGWVGSWGIGSWRRTSCNCKCIGCTKLCAILEFHFIEIVYYIFLQYSIYITIMIVLLLLNSNLITIWDQITTVYYMVKFMTANELSFHFPSV